MRPATLALLLSMGVAAPVNAGTESSTQEVGGEVVYDVSAVVGASSGEFAPYMIGSLNHGKTTQKTTTHIDAVIRRGISTDRRFSWGFGAEAIVGYGSGNRYDRWDEAEHAWGSHKVNPPAAWLQQFYGEVKYRGAFLSAGLREHESALLDNNLSSGDLVESGNSRPIPELRAGFINFQDIPFTNGWVQIEGVMSFGKMTDNGYMKSHFNYYNYHISTGSFYCYKRCYFRSNPSKPLSVTAGMQAGSLFGGSTCFYSDGKLVETRKYSSSLSTFLKMALPIGENGEGHYMGANLGSWDVHIRYRLSNNDEISAYFQGPWEDGSGIGRMNGWDGLWGLEYKTSRLGWLSAIVFEVMDFRNQSGPLHWAPSDYPGTTITTPTGGEDNYYNSAFYNSYANYGMAIGTPVLPSPLYNLDGFPAFECNRLNGVHFGVMGSVTSAVDYRVLVGYARGLGRYSAPYAYPRRSTSVLLESRWDASAIMPGLSAKAQIAFDSGDLRGDNFGAFVTVAYRGLLSK